MAYGSSRTWKSEKVLADENWVRRQKALRRRYPKSRIFNEGFKIREHEAAVEYDGFIRAHFGGQQEAEEMNTRLRMGIPPLFAPAPPRPAFDGKNFSTNHSSVLAQKTVFCPQFREGKVAVSPWPTKAEMVYEGDSRISTDQLHRRFPSLPRVQGHNTANWQQLAAIDQYPLDKVHVVPSSVDVFIRWHKIKELEFTDEQGEQRLGKDFMDMLDMPSMC